MLSINHSYGILCVQKKHIKDYFSGDIDDDETVLIKVVVTVEDAFLNLDTKEC